MSDMETTLNPMPLFHENLQVLRERAGISRYRLAKAMNINAAAIRSAERGERNIRVHELWLAARFLGIPISSFFAPTAGHAIELSKRAHSAAA